MTIKTLTFIHKALTDEAWSREQVYRAARKLQHEFEDRENADTGLVENQKKAADELYEYYLEASRALEDFEAQEW